MQNHGANARAQGPIRHIHILVLKYEVLVQCMRHDDLCVMYLGWNWVTHNGRSYFGSRRRTTERLTVHPHWLNQQGPGIPEPTEDIP